MFRLTLNPESTPEIHLFNQSSIALGSDPALVHLVIPGSDIFSIHLRMIKLGKDVVILNEANDPFASVNGHPFGKKFLHSGDLIKTLETAILFEILDPDFDQKQGDRKDNIDEGSFQAAVDDETRSQSHGLPNFDLKPVASFSLPFEQDFEGIKEDLDDDALDRLLKELESSEEISAQMTPLPPSLQSSNKKPGLSLKDDYLRDLEDDMRHPAAHAPEVSKAHHSLYRAWKWVLFFIFSLLVISGLAGTIIYLTMSNKTEAQETKVAQGVADLAMALTHAKLNRLKPHNQNWADVEFLKSNLQSILPETASYASQVDAQGQFNCCPYTLRIYTNGDLSHFLLIAQPAPNLTYWLFPPSVIMVDSHLMELRTLKDVKSLNRLLANPDPLDGPNGKEITALIKKGELFSLATLASDTGNSDFNTPKNLAWIIPGAENFIYNAPRYYRLGENIVHQAIHLSTTKGSSKEVSALKQDVSNYASLNHFILYSNQGKKSADLTRQGIAMFAPTDNLLFGYVLFNAKGKIQQVHLLKEEEGEQATTPFGASENETAIAYQTFNEASVHSEQAKPVENALVDRNHPIFIQLHALVTARENELKPLISALFTLVNQELMAPRAQFQVEYQNLSHTYLMANAKHKRILKGTLEGLFEKYENVPIRQFWAYLQELHLDQLIQQEENALSVVDENCQHNMEALLTHIENSKSLPELNNIIHIATSWLNFDYIKDPQELMKYQNLLRNQLLEQLERALLTQKTQIVVKEEDREVLQDILHQERLIKPEERDFFLEEFEDLVKDARPIDQNK